MSDGPESTTSAPVSECEAESGDDDPEHAPNPIALIIQAALARARTRSTYPRPSRSAIGSGLRAQRSPKIDRQMDAIHDWVDVARLIEHADEDAAAENFGRFDAGRE